MGTARTSPVASTDPWSIACTIRIFQLIQRGVAGVARTTPGSLYCALGLPNRIWSRGRMIYSPDREKERTC